MWVMEFTLNNFGDEFEVFPWGKGSFAQTNNDSLARLAFIVAERLNELPALAS